MLNDLLPPGTKQRTAAVVAAAALVLFAITQLYLKTPIGIVFLGICLGMVTALTAVRDSCSSTEPSDL